MHDLMYEPVGFEPQEEQFRGRAARGGSGSPEGEGGSSSSPDSNDNSSGTNDSSSSSEGGGSSSSVPPQFQVWLFVP